MNIERCLGVESIYEGANPLTDPKLLSAAIEAKKCMADKDLRVGMFIFSNSQVVALPESSFDQRHVVVVDIEGIQFGKNRPSAPQDI